jgi:hypothetical protein
MIFVPLDWVRCIIRWFKRLYWRLDCLQMHHLEHKMKIRTKNRKLINVYRNKLYEMFNCNIKVEHVCMLWDTHTHICENNIWDTFQLLV